MGQASCTISGAWTTAVLKRLYLQLFTHAITDEDLTKMTTCLVLTMTTSRDSTVIILIFKYYKGAIVTPFTLMGQQQCYISGEKLHFKCNIVTFLWQKYTKRLSDTTLIDPKILFITTHLKKTRKRSRDVNQW